MKIEYSNRKPLQFTDITLNGYASQETVNGDFNREISRIRNDYTQDANSQASNMGITSMLSEIQVTSSNILHKETTVSPSTAAKAYARSISFKEQVQMYIDEQLLSNPGGDNYDENTADAIFKGHHNTFTTRIKKDFSDVVANIRNFFLDLTVGSSFRYRDQDGKVQTAHKPGFISSVGSFFRHILSGITFGLYVPQGEEKPSGILERVGHFFRSMYRAVFGDGIKEMVESVNHMAEDAILSVWNMAEVVPDATVGNIPKLREGVSRLFDGGQVVLDYVTDIAPGGEAWMRVHSADLSNGKPPFIANLQKPIKSNDKSWRYVKNTFFRKVIETIGSLGADILGFLLLRSGWTNSESDKDRK